MDDLLRRILEGSMTLKELPDKIDLSPFWPSMDELFRKSFNCPLPVPPPYSPLQENLVEWGSCFVLADRCVSLPHWNSGTRRDVDPAPNCQTPDHDPPVYVGFVHTHVLPHNGTPHPAGFSDRDYNAGLADGDRLAVVTNGTKVFALVRLRETAPWNTKEQQERLKQLFGTEEKKRWEPLIDDLDEEASRLLSTPTPERPLSNSYPSRLLWEIVRQGPFPLANARDLAFLALNWEACESLGYALYMGEYGARLQLHYSPGDIP